ncbi:NADH-quinone oxidoreductase subunit N [Desulfurivibrio dismutans]|uniref:NADH-quinone oxidoreductase subunit N n=1 Tax=Desulfurivibrio dismutans TaxID=1398908 RepID=UPI0023DBE036|nr:NADH-quinone oxidoreductase subunit N [Desulfurivibrio alkaliphilus]MDF1614027.1 NADH-quinone oxidoreductase subunit N [Desulfurivibrio alkaliphilus]
MKILLFLPELTLLLGALVLFQLSVAGADGRKARLTALLFAAGAAVFSLVCLGQQGTLFFEALRMDFFSQLVKLILALGLVAVLVIGRELKDIADGVRPEYYLFMLCSVVGLMMLVSSAELLTLFMALELSSYCLYLMVPMRDDRKGLRVQMEAAVKYVIFGVLASGIMLFGMSYLFALSGSTHLPEMVPVLAAMLDNPAVLVGIVMVMAGFFYKLAIFPFHFWVPDVYQGASNETTTFIASLPKIAAAAMLIKISTLAAPGAGADTLVVLLTLLAVLSMFYGNLSALVQTDIKRMLGFSGIAHAGFILVGVLTLDVMGYAAALYYATGYVVMSLACFLVICNVSRNGENVQIEDLSGLYQRAPLLALVLAVGLFALAGIPPFVGFMGKFFLLTSALNQGHLALVILAAINTAIAIYYYLSVVRVVYTAEPESRPAIGLNIPTRALGIVLVLIIIALGVLPGSALDTAAMAVRSLG